MALSDVDRQLLQRCVTDQPNAWEEFVDRFLGLVLHVVDHAGRSRQITIPPQDREDIAAEVFLALIADDYKVLKRFRQHSSLATYLTVIARASSEKSEAKMLSAGATRVLNPYRTGGGLMVRQLLHPSVTEFMDAIQQFGDPELCLEEIQIQSGSQLAGKSLDNSPIKSEMDVLVVGIRRDTADLIFNPPSTLALDAGDMLLVMAHPQSLRRLEKLAEG